MGRLYLGRDPDPNIDRLVAIKLLKEGFDNKELRERFNREAKSASGLRHASIVTIFETGTHNGQPFIVMEYIHGDTLSELIQRRHHLTLERKLDLMESMFAGLHYAHRKHVIHRDIKPANLMIDDEGGLRILDFGIARLARGAATGPGLTEVGSVMGTLNYIAPEQLRADPLIDGRADMFSAGAVFYELLSYQRAFPGEPPAIFQKIFGEEPKPLGQLSPTLDADLIAIVDRCLRKNPDERYPDCGAVHDSLRAFRRNQGDNREMPTMPVTPIRNREELRRIRTAQIRWHVDAAQRAFSGGDYNGALQASQQALLLDPENADALSVDERARSALDQQRLLREALDVATAELDRGALTAAANHVYRALAINPESVEALRLRQGIDDARRRLADDQERKRRVAAALARGWEALRAGALSTAESCAAEIIAIDPGNQDVDALKTEITAAAEAGRRAEADAQAAHVMIDQARRRAAAGDFAGAINQLGRFQPLTLVADAMAELRAAEQDHRHRTIDAALEHGWEALKHGDFAVARADADKVVSLDRDNPEAQSLNAEIAAAIEQARRAEADAKASRAVIAQARQRAWAGDHRTALEMLQRFQPPALVADAIAELRKSQEEFERQKAEAERRRREEEEQIARQQAEAERRQRDEEARIERQKAEAEQSRRQEEERQRAQAERREQQIQHALAEAKTLMQARELNQALGTVQRVLGSDPDHPDAVALLATIRDALSRRHVELQKTHVVPQTAGPESVTRLPDEPAAADPPPSIAEVGPSPAKTLLNPLLVPSDASRIEPVAPQWTAVPSETIEAPVEIAARRNLWPVWAAAAAMAIVIGGVAWRFIGGERAVEPNPAPTVQATPTPAPEAQAPPQAPPPQPTVTPALPEPAASPQADSATRQLAQLRTTATDQWRRGDASSALSSVASALRLQPRDASTKSLVDDFLREARQRSANAAAVARVAGVENTPTASSARARESEANRLARSEQPVQAVQAYLDAAALFLKASSERGAPTGPAPGVAAVDPPQRPVEPPPPVQTAPPPVAPPPPEPKPAPDPPPSAAPARSDSPPPARPEAASPPRPATAAAPAVQDDEAAIRETLQRYKAAYERLSPEAVKAIFPAANAAGLANAFKDYVSVKLTIDIEKVQVNQDGRTASVTASVTNAPVVKVGRANPQPRRTVYTMRKQGPGWLIESIR